MKPLRSELHNLRERKNITISFQSKTTETVLLELYLGSAIVCYSPGWSLVRGSTTTTTATTTTIIISIIYSLLIKQIIGQRGNVGLYNGLSIAAGAWVVVPALSLDSRIFLSLWASISGSSPAVRRNRSFKSLSLSPISCISVNCNHQHV